MSEPESSETPAAPPAPDAPPRIGLIEIDLRQLIGAERMNPLEVLAATIALIRLIEEVRDTNRERVDEILHGAWSTVSRIVLFRMHRPGWEVQLRLLQEWFTHRGDWAAMRRSLIQSGESRQSRPGELAELIDQHAAQAREQYARIYPEAK